MKKAVLLALSQKSGSLDEVARADVQRFQALIFENFERHFAHKDVIIAVSGGSDSMALLRLLKLWNGARKLRAVTVDHCLREASAFEAQWVQAQCELLEVDHVTASWEDAQSGSGISQRARAARYQLLSHHAHKSGSVIALGHTRNDQIETLRMRLLRDAPHSNAVEGDQYITGTQRGLMGMSTIVSHLGVEFHRPLLGISRENLRDWLKAKGPLGLGAGFELAEESDIWLEDPTNLDARFERPRLRKHEISEQYQIQLLGYAHCVRKWRAVQSQSLSAGLQSFVRCALPNCYSVDLSRFARLPIAQQQLLLGWLVALSGHLERPVLSHALRQACVHKKGISLSNVRVDFARADEIWIYREIRDPNAKIDSKLLSEFSQKLSANDKYQKGQQEKGKHPKDKNRLPPRSAIEQHLLSIGKSKTQQAQIIEKNQMPPQMPPCLNQWISKEDLPLVQSLRELCA